MAKKPLIKKPIKKVVKKSSVKNNSMNVLDSLDSIIPNDKSSNKPKLKVSAIVAKTKKPTKKIKKTKKK